MNLTTAKAATITTATNRVWWTCPNCHRTMGEIVGMRLVIIVRGRQMTFPLVVGTCQTCPHCGHESEYRGP